MAWNLSLCLLAACSDIPAESPGGSIPAREGYVRLAMTASVPEFRTIETRAGGSESDALAAMKAHFYAFCFDTHGGLLEVVNVASPAQADGGYTATAEVPARTRIIHFIAGPDLSEEIAAAERGTNELTLIPGLTSGFKSGKESASSYPQEIVRSFWGRAEAPSEEALKSQLNVQLLANYAEVTCRITTQNGTVARPEGQENTSYRLTGFTVLNRRAYGTIAPFNAEASGTAAFDYDPMDGAKRFLTEVGNEETRELLLSNPKTAKTVPGAAVPVYDNPNALTAPVYAVIQLTNGYDLSRFYKVSLIDMNADQYPITRNCRYAIKISGMPPIDMSYDSMAEAAKSDVIPVNNPWVTVEPETPSIGDGSSSLTVDGSLYKGYSQAGEQQFEVIYKAPAGADAAGTKVSASIISDDEVLDGNLTVEPAAGKAGTWVVKFKTNTPPKPAGNKRYAEAQILVKGGKYGRIVHLYLMQPFSFQSVTLNDLKIGADNIAGGKKAPTEELQKGMEKLIKYTIPSNYPEKLLPVKVKITSNLWNAYRLPTIDWPYKNLSISYEETRFTVLRNGVPQEIALPYDFKYIYPMDTYDNNGMYRYEYTVQMICSYAQSETDVNDCPIKKDEYKQKMHVHFFLEAEHFNTQEIIVRFANPSNTGNN